MKKKVFGRKLSRDYGSRQALFRALVRALVLHGSIKTTKAKAKSIQNMVDKMVTLSKKETVSSKRRIYSKMANDREISQMIIDLSKRFKKTRTSGYTRIIPLPLRRGDNAQVVRLEWTEKVSIPTKGKEKEETKKATGKKGSGKKAVSGKKTTDKKKVKEEVKNKKVSKKD